MENQGEIKTQKRPGPVKFQLKYEVQSGSETITEINLKRPIAKQLRHLGDDFDMGDLLDLAITVGDQPKHVIDSLDSEDTMRLVEVMTDFLVPGQKPKKGKRR